MQKNKSLIAFLFLGVFSILLMHQIVPHLHHDHEVLKIASTHADDHHHKNVPDKESETATGFIDLFLGMHVHVIVVDEIPVFRNVVNNQQIAKNYTFETTPLFLIVFKNYSEVEKSFFYNPPNNYFNSYTANLELRGPPIVG